jgi:hypothetical protein
MGKKTKPHVSAALAHLRSGVTWSAVAVTLCIITQLLVFGFVHFTELRFAAPEAKAAAAPDQPLQVVPAVREPRRDLSPPGGATVRTPDETPAEPQAPPRRLSPFNNALHYASDYAAAFGVASSAVFFSLIFLGVVVAAGGAVPGVEKAVSASTWSLVLALLCLPWYHFVPTAPWPGVFSSYAIMTVETGSVDVGQSSGASLLATYLVLPIAALLATLLILARFRAGVEAGVIIQSVSELDRAIEREAEEIMRRGISVSGPRAVGALNAAIGSAQDTDAPPLRSVRRKNTDDEPAEMPTRIAEGLPRPAPVRERRRQPVEDDDEDFRRPI